MILKEAEQILNLHSFENIEDALEQSIFPIKTFLLTAPILHKTFLAKLEKLAIIDEAYQLICETPSEISKHEALIFIVQTNVLTSHVHYETLIAAAQLKISATNKPREIIEICKHLLTTHSSYVEMWKDCEFLISSNVILSKQMDRMSYHEELTNLHQKGIRTIDAIRMNENLLSNEFKVEVTRLQKSVS
jgi:hypothetical protein